MHLHLPLIALTSLLDHLRVPPLAETVACLEHVAYRRCGMLSHGLRRLRLANTLLLLLSIVFWFDYHLVRTSIFFLTVVERALWRRGANVAQVADADSDPLVAVLTPALEVHLHLPIPTDALELDHFGVVPVAVAVARLKHVADCRVGLPHLNERSDGPRLLGRFSSLNRLVLFVTASRANWLKHVGLAAR